VVTGGGLSADGSQWISCRDGFFLPVGVLSRLFRRLFLEYLVIANIFQRTDLVRRHCNSPLDGPRAVPAIPHAYCLRPPSVLTRDPAGIQYT